MRPNHENMKGLVAAYVLRAVSPDETEQMRAHMVSCDECMAEADGYTEIVSALALSVDPEPLPPGFVEGVMATVATRTAESRLDSPGETDAPAEPVDSGREATVTQLPRLRPAYALMAAAAVALIVAVLAGALISTTNDLNDTRTDLARERDRIAQLADSEDAIRLGSPGGEAVAAMLPTDEGGVFVVHGLRDAPKDRTYQVWLIEDDKPISAGTFDPDSGLGTLQTDHSLANVEAVAVTVEPKGGSESPTGLQILHS